MSDAARPRPRRRRDPAGERRREQPVGRAAVGAPRARSGAADDRSAAPHGAATGRRRPRRTTRPPATRPPPTARPATAAAGRRAPPAEPLPEDRFLNRELSWLDFNARVLALAEDPATPLLERAKFLAIFASNLDEFYMVRVAGLKRRLQTGLPVRGGRTACRRASSSS